METFPARRRVYLMRHGEVDYFLNGRPVPPPEARLNDEGRAQATAAGAALSGIPLDRAVVSGLARTVETATLVLRGRDLPLETLPELEEIRGGHLADVPRAELRSVFLEALTHRLSAETRFLNGERYDAFFERVTQAFRALVADTGWQNMLIVAHGAVNRALLADVLQAPVEAMGHLEQDAGCINIIDFDERGYGIIRLLNYTPYNATKEGIALTTMERYFLQFPPQDS